MLSRAKFIRILIPILVIGGVFFVYKIPSIITYFKVRHAIKNFDNTPESETYKRFLVKEREIVLPYVVEKLSKLTYVKDEETHLQAELSSLFCEFVPEYAPICGWPPYDYLEGNRGTFWKEWYDKNKPFLYWDSRNNFYRINLEAKECGIPLKEWVELSKGERYDKLWEREKELGYKWRCLGIVVEKTSTEDEDISSNTTLADYLNTLGWYAKAININNKAEFYLSLPYFNTPEWWLETQQHIIGYGDKAIGALLYLYDRVFNYAYRETIIRIIAKMDTPKSRQVMLELLDDNDDIIREVAIRHLSNYAPPEYVSKLVMERIEDYAIWSHRLYSTVQTKNDCESLIKALYHSSKTVRIRAAGALQAALQEFIGGYLEPVWDEDNLKTQTKVLENWYNENKDYIYWIRGKEAEKLGIRQKSVKINQEAKSLDIPVDEKTGKMIDPKDGHELTPEEIENIKQEKLKDKDKNPKQPTPSKKPQ